MSTQKFSVTGLTCQGCVRTVTTALDALEGVREVSVDLDAGEVSTVSLDGDHEVAPAQVQAALSAAGAFTVQG